MSALVSPSLAQYEPCTAWMRRAAPHALASAFDEITAIANRRPKQA